MKVRVTHHRESHHARSESQTKSDYSKLLLMGLIHFPLMYAIMFAMVNSFDDVFHNLNTLYMAGMMVAPMMILMPILMGTMYTDRKLNTLVYFLSGALLLAFYLFTRQQAFINDTQFLRSMIPHHSSAILMCNNAKIHDAEIRDLCDGIVKSQSSEIDQMRKILGRIKKSN